MSAATEDVVPSDIAVGKMVWDLAFHPTSDIVALGCIDGSVQIHRYAVDETQPIFNLKPHKDGVRSLDFSPDGRALYTISSDNTLKAIECSTAKTIFDKRDTGHPDALNVVHFLTEQLFVTGCDGGVVSLWDTRQHTPAMQWSDLLGMGIHCFTHRTDKGHILAGTDNGSIAIFGLRKAEAEVLTGETDDSVMSLSLINKDSQVAAGCGSGQIRIWKYGVWDKPCDNLKGHPAEVEGIISIRDGDMITACCDGCVRAVRLTPQPKLLDTLGFVEDALSMRLARSRCGALVGCAGGETITFFDVRRYVTGTFAETPHGSSFLKPASSSQKGAEPEDSDDEEEEEEDEEEAEHMEEDEKPKSPEEKPKKAHKKGKHRMDMNREAAQSKQQKFFKGL
ncbi:WD repeat-containing protein 55-like protein [Diplonema papillatum]|nr:WD repeat-containing protein 55-like protein [Diplonema papillatum]|eukprot:gene15354-23474_t